MSVRAPMLADFIKGESKARVVGCEVCGATQRATKATGRTYLP